MKIKMRLPVSFWFKKIYIFESLAEKRQLLVYYTVRVFDLMVLQISLMQSDLICIH